MGSPRGRRRRWQGCIYLPYSQYTKVPRSTRYAADSSRWQSTLLGGSRENGGERGQNKKKTLKERGGGGRRKGGRKGRWDEERKRETEVKARGKSATRVRRSLSGNVGDRSDKSRRPTRRRCRSSRDKPVERLETRESGPDASRVIAYRRVFRAVPVTWHPFSSELAGVPPMAVGMSTVIGRDVEKGKW